MSISHNQLIKINDNFSIPGYLLYAFRIQWKLSGQLNPDAFILARENNKHKKRRTEQELKSLVHWCQKNPETSISNTKPIKITDTLIVTGNALYNFRERWKASGQLSPDAFIRAKNRKTQRTDEELKAIVRWCQKNPDVPLSQSQAIKVTDSWTIPARILADFRERWKARGKLDPDAFILARKKKQKTYRTNAELIEMARWCQKNQTAPINQTQTIKITDKLSVLGTSLYDFRERWKAGTLRNIVWLDFAISDKPDEIPLDNLELSSPARFTFSPDNLAPYQAEGLNETPSHDLGLSLSGGLDETLLGDWNFATANEFDENLLDDLGLLSTGLDVSPSDNWDFVTANEFDENILDDWGLLSASLDVSSSDNWNFATIGGLDETPLNDLALSTFEELNEIPYGRLECINAK